MQQIIKSLDKALDIIMYLHYSEVEKSLSDISSNLKLGKSTVYRMLKTLEIRGFIEQNPESEKYSLGMKFYLIGSNMQEQQSLLQILTPYAKQLFEKFGEVINISVLDELTETGYHSVIIYKEENPDKVLTVNPKVGRSMECHCAAVGKCLLAYSKNVDLSIYKDLKLKKHTHKTITNYEDILDEIKKIKRFGYAIDDEEQEEELFCIAIPVLNKDGNALAAISISGRKNNIKNKCFDQMVQYLLSMKEVIQRDFR